MTARMILAALLLILTPAAARCQITRGLDCNVSASAVEFGNIELTRKTTSVGSIIVHCTGNGSTNFFVDLSTGSSGDYAQRKMQGPSNGTILYNLYLNPGFTKIWGDGSGGTDDFRGKIQLMGGSIDTENISVYGEVPNQSSQPPGSYSDTITVTITY